MIGVDEVGRGAWGGPLLVVAARLKHDNTLLLRDSKKLTPLSRQKLSLEIVKFFDIGYGWVDVAELDSLGLSKALRLGAKRSLQAIKAEHTEEIILDGKVNFLPGNFTRVKLEVGADDKWPAVSAASIVAKVTRDSVMSQIGEFHPEYGFDKHVGYGTAQHRSAISKYGPVQGVHRLSFKPLKDLKQ